MANKQVGSTSGVVNKQRTGTGANHVSGGSLVASPVNYASIADLRAALTSFNAGYYTATMLDRMTMNDMVYAVRNHNDGGIGTSGVI